MKTICNGYSTGNEHLSEETQKIIKELLPEIRKELKVKYQDLENEFSLYAGERFYDDFSVMMRLESAWEKLEKAYIDIKDRVRDALLDCMRADYYYTFEKDWGED